MTHCKINKKNEWKYSTSQRNTKDVQVSALTKIEFLYIMIPDSCNGILDFIKVIQIIGFLLSFWFYGMEILFQNIYLIVAIQLRDQKHTTVVNINSWRSRKHEASYDSSIGYTDNYSYVI